jgi:hypothetical protein
MIVSLRDEAEGWSQLNGKFCCSKHLYFAKAAYCGHFDERDCYSMPSVICSCLESERVNYNTVKKKTDFDRLIRMGMHLWVGDERVIRPERAA